MRIFLTQIPAGSEGISEFGDGANSHLVVLIRKLRHVWVAPPSRQNVISNHLIYLYIAYIMADREGFEPPIPLRVCRISSAVLSTAQPPVRKAAEHNDGLARPQGADLESARKPIHARACACAAPQQRQDFSPGGPHLSIEAVRRIDDQQSRSRKLARGIARRATDIERERKQFCGARVAEFTGQCACRRDLLERLPNKIDSVRKTAVGVGKYLCYPLKLVFFLIWRIDQHHASTFRRRHQNRQLQITIVCNRPRIRKRGECHPQGSIFVGMLLDREQAILWTQNPRCEQRRTGVILRTEAADDFQIFSQRRALCRRAAQCSDTVIRLSCSLRLLCRKIVQATAGMRVDDGKRRLLPAQMEESRDKRRVFVHVREIAGVIGMPVIHSRFTRRGRRTSLPPQLGQMYFISSLHALQKVHS